MIRFEVYCNAERRVIGDLELPEKTKIDVDRILSGFTPVLAEYHLKALPGEKDERVKDGCQVLCPKCSNPILIREPQGDKGVYLVPGGFGTA